MIRRFPPHPWGILAVLSLLMIPAAGCAQSGDPTADPRFEQAVDLFEAWLDAEMDYEKIPAVSVGLVHDQDLVWAKGYGYAHPDAGVAATPSTMYSICSISKLFTSIGVMQQRDEGKLRLDDAVSGLLPWFDLEQAYPDGPNVTVEGILTHSSGLPRESAHPYWTGPDFPFPTREEIIEGLSDQETLYPGARYFQYSNLGMSLAGQLVEQASGMTYDEYVRSRILDPLGMADTYTDIPTEHKGDRFATGYTRLGRDGQRHEATFFQARGIAPAAGFASTVEDLARLASWQFRLLEDGGTEVLGVNTLQGNAPRPLGRPGLRHHVGTRLRGVGARRSAHRRPRGELSGIPDHAAAGPREEARRSGDDQRAGDEPGRRVVEDGRDPRPGPGVDPR